MEDASYRGLKQQLAKADRAQQYREAVRVGTQLREAYEREMDAEDWYRLGTALRRSERPGEALEVCRRLYRRHSELPQVRGLYAWCVYDLAVRPDDSPIGETDEELFDAAEAIVQLTSELPPGSFTPLVQTVFRVVAHMKEQGGANEEILRWTDHLDPGEISDQVGTLRKEDGSTVELPSDRERWFSARTKALFELDRYQECLDLCETALQRVARFSGQNQVWIWRRRALCREELGQFQEALDELRRVVRIEPRWFVFRDLARMYARRRDYDRALELGCRGALEGEIDGFRWGLFKQLAEVLEAREDFERAHLHAVLAMALREEKGWPIGDAHRRWADRLGVDLEELPAPGRVVDRLEEFWRRVRRAALPGATATVREYDAEAGIGYADSEDGEQVLIRMGRLRAPAGDRGRAVRGESRASRGRERPERRRTTGPVPEPGQEIEGLLRSSFDPREEAEIRELTAIEMRGSDLGSGSSGFDASAGSADGPDRPNGPSGRGA